ncbi:MAG: hypothetical protein WC694_00185 [Candidatus Paceibacterota bacterium]|jgi:hypothetical protein
MQNKKIDKKINIGVKEIKQIKMTTGEKNFMLLKILNSPTLSNTHIKNPWSFHSFIFNLQKNRLIHYGFVPCMMIIFGSGVVIASQKSLPGNIFYPLKVKVVEPTYSRMMLSKESEARYESSLAIGRMVEAETLANQDKLDNEKERQLNDLLINHTNTLSKTLNDIPKEEESSDNKVKDNIIIEFQNQMNTHAQVLDDIREKNNTKIHDIEKDENNTNISDTARNNANKIKDELRNENRESDSDREQDRENQQREKDD